MFKLFATIKDSGKMPACLPACLPNLNFKLAKIFFKAAQSHIFFNRMEVFHAG